MNVDRGWMAAVVMVLGLAGCHSEVGSIGQTFRCQTGADCADGFECVDVPDESGTRVCKRPGEGFPSRDAGDEADTDTSGPSGDAGTDTADVEVDPDVRPHPNNELVVTSGGDFSCAFRAAGDAYCWGRNQEGQLGTGVTTEDNASTPVPVEMPGTYFIATPKTVDSKFRGTCAIGVDRAVYCWGRNNGGNANPESTDLVVSPTRVEFSDASLKFAQVVVGFNHACALTKDGELYCWGSNVHGQQGVGSSGESEVRMPPRRVDESALEKPEEVFIEVAAGLDFTCASTNVDRVFCWGWDDRGRLASGEEGFVGETDTPRQISSVNWEGKLVEDLTAYTATACMRVSEGEAYCWGDNEYGQVGVGSTSALPHVEPSVVATDVPFDKLYAGEHHTCAITNGKHAVCWGTNGRSQLGLEEPPNGPVAQPGESVRRPASNEELLFRHLAPGVGHTCGVTYESNPRVFCWGDNAVGQLGNGSESGHTSMPQQVELP